MESVLFLIVVLVLIDVGADVVVANLVRQRLRAVGDEPGAPMDPPRSVRSLVTWHRACALAQIAALVVLVYACLRDVSGFGAAEPLPAGRPLLITAIVAAVLASISVPGMVLVGRGLRGGRRREWRLMVRAGGKAPVTGVIVGAVVIGACLVLTVPEPVQETVVAIYLANIALTIPYRRAFLHLDTWRWFTSRVDDEVSER